MSKPVTICIDARYLAKPGVGIYEYLCAVIRILIDRKVTITLIGETTIHEPAEILERCDYIVLPPRYNCMGLWWEQITVLKYLRRQHFDVYWAPANQGLPLGYFGKTKLILNIHDLIRLQFLWFYLRQLPLETIAYVLSVTVSVYKAKAIMAISQATKQDIQHRFKRSSTEVLIPISRMHIGIHGKSMHKHRQFVYNGGRDARKNVDLLLRGFALFHASYPQYKLILMGKGYDADDPLIYQLGIQDAVIKTGYVTHEEKMKILCQSTAMVYPSRTEGYGLPIVEAYSVGLPVICGTGGAQREIAGDAGIFLDPITTESIANAFTDIANGKLPQDNLILQREQLAYLMSPQHEQKIVEILQCG
jgi:glycosyltransferase involved in cell wall biosynthesis